MADVWKILFRIPFRVENGFFLLINISGLIGIRWE